MVICNKTSGEDDAFFAKGKLEISYSIWSCDRGKTDISEYLYFDFYGLVWYFPGVHPSISEDKRALGIWLGISHLIRISKFYWIMKKIVTPIAETTVQHFTRYYMLDADIINQIIQSNDALDSCHN